MITVSIFIMLSIYFLQILRKRSLFVAILNNRSSLSLFYAGMILSLLFSFGFLAQMFLDAYATGNLSTAIENHQTIPAHLIDLEIGQSAVNSIIPSIGAIVAIFLFGRGFVRSIIASSIGSVSAIIIRFLVVFWSRPYQGVVGLSLLMAILGSVVASTFAVAMVNEANLRGWLSTLKVKNVLTSIVSVIFSALLFQFVLTWIMYFAFIYRIPKHIDLNFNKWNYSMVTGSTMHPVSVTPFGAASGYLPATKFGQSLLSEEVLPALDDNKKTKTPTLSLQFSKIDYPSYSYDDGYIKHITTSEDSPPSRPDGFNLRIQAFVDCTFADIHDLSKKFRLGKLGSSNLALKAAELKFPTLQSFLFNPVDNDNGLQIMLPAWKNSWIHIKPYHGGISIGAQEPLAAPTRALFISSNPISLVVTDAQAEPDLGEVSVDHVNKNASMSRPIICTQNYGKDLSRNGDISWPGIFDTKGLVMNGYLVLISGKQKSDEKIPYTYAVQVSNTDKPTDMVERLVAQIDPNTMATSFLPDVEASVIQVDERSGSNFSGTFGQRHFTNEQFDSVTVAGNHLKLNDNKMTTGGLKMTGTATVLDQEDTSVFFDFANELGDKILYGVGAAVVSGLATVLVLIFRRFKLYDQDLFASVF